MRTDAIRLTQKQQALLRRQAIRLREKGRSTEEVAQNLGVHKKTVSGWWAKYDRIGAALFEPGKRGRHRGDQRILTAHREGEVKRLISEQPPDRLKLPFTLWSRSAVGKLIEGRYGIILPIRTLGEYLQRWGYTPPKPQKRASERDDHAMRTWLAEKYPKIIREARREGALLFWGDQNGVNGEATLTPRSFSHDDFTIPLRTSIPITLSMIRAVTNRGSVCFLMYKGALNVADLVWFYGRLVVSTEGRIVYLILDHVQAHYTLTFRQWIDDHRQQFKVYYLPTVRS